MELKEIKLEHFGNEPLQSSYITFAEKFLAKVAEAADAGRPVKPVVVKAAYKSAIDKEVPLKTWLEGDKWRGVDHAHKRLLRKLREARSWEAMSMAVRKRTPMRLSDHDHSDEGDADPRRRRLRPVARRKSNATAKSVRKMRSSSTRARRSNASSFGVNRRDVGGGKREQARTSGPREKLRSWKGCDSRGDSWHTDKELFDCFKKPCNADFCQRCAKHGHTADYCKVPEGTEGLNTFGFFQEQRPGKSGPKRPPASRVNNSSSKRGPDPQSSDGSGSEDDDSPVSGSGRSRGSTARRSNSSRGQKGRGRL
jgi:hypothetical protein